MEFQNQLDDHSSLIETIDTVGIYFDYESSYTYQRETVV